MMGLAQTRLEVLDAVGERFPGQVGTRACDLHERELERKARVAALAGVVDRHRQQIDEPNHLRLGELVRLRAQPLPRLLRHRNGFGHLAEMLDEEEVS